MSLAVPRKYTTSSFKDWYVPEREKTQEEKERELLNKQLRKVKKTDLVEDMLDIILKHKKEIRKIPQCSHINGAQDWARKRRLEAREADLDHDGTPEVVVFEKDGQTPYVVNGYALKPSDYAVRHEYWKTHQKDWQRVGEPMGDWIKGAYTYEEDPDNRWNKKNIKTTKLGDDLSKWDGFRMPTKPKKQASPYSIFSKLIAPMVKKLFVSDWIRKTMHIEHTEGKNEFYYPLIWNKFVSPISIYRFLYLRLVEQKFYYKQLLDLQVANPGKTVEELGYTYERFKRDLKKNNAVFVKWFYDTYLVGTRKESFNKNAVNMSLIEQNMIKGEANFDGADANDGLIHLLGGGHTFLNKSDPVYIDEDETPIFFQDLICNENCAKEFYDILIDKEHPQYRRAKAAVAFFKQTAADYVKNIFFSDAGLNAMMNNYQAFNDFLTSISESNGKSPNITSAAGLNRYLRAGGSVSPKKRRMEEVRQEEPNPAPLDDGEPTDDEDN